MEKNLLTSLPESIGKLKKLQIIELRDNELETLPESIGSLNKLANLFLNNNNLKVLPKSLANLTNLTRLELSGNNIDIENKINIEVFNALEKNGCFIIIEKGTTWRFLRKYNRFRRKE